MAGGERGGPGAGRDAQVWLLGNRHSAADRSIGWHDPLPNLGDSDVLIVDLTTLTRDVIRTISLENLNLAKKYIGDKFLGGGGTIVIITDAELSTYTRDVAPLPQFLRASGETTYPLHHCSNYHIVPVSVKTTPLKGDRIKPNPGHEFRSYLDAVKGFKFHIAVDDERLDSRFHSFQLLLAKEDGQSVMDNSGNYLGFTLIAVEESYDMRKRRAANTGALVFLPPPTEPAADAIERLLSLFGRGSPSGGTPPSWAEKLSFRSADKLQAQIAGLEERAAAIHDQIGELRSRKDKILDHRRLLYASGDELEVAVVNALVVLGFAEARQTKRRDQADCVIDMSVDGYQHGLVEVKGSDGRAGERDISQCVKWVDKKHEADETIAKGILVANQHRNAEYPGSLNDRLWLEDKETDYARMRDVCIIPSYVLFEAVRKVLDGATPDRNAIEQKIADTKGVLCDVP